MKQPQQNIYQGLTDQELELAVRAVRQYLEARRVAVEHGQPVPEGPSITIGNVAVPVRDMAPGAVRRLFAEYEARQQKPQDTHPLHAPDSTQSPWHPWDNPQDYFNARAERMP